MLYAMIDVGSNTIRMAIYEFTISGAAGLVTVLTAARNKKSCQRYRETQ